MDSTVAFLFLPSDSPTRSLSLSFLHHSFGAMSDSSSDGVFFDTHHETTVPNKKRKLYLLSTCGNKIFMNCISFHSAIIVL